MKKRTAAPAVLGQAHKAGLVKIELLMDLADELADGNLASVHERLGALFEFIDGELSEHFRQEEEILFPALEEPLAGPGPITFDGEEPEFCTFLFCEASCRIAGPLAIYRRDHQMIRTAIDKLRAAWQELGRACGDVEARRRVEQAAAEVQWLLGSHIAKEEEVLMPKAEEVLSGPELAEIDLALARAAQADPRLTCRRFLCYR